MNGTWRAGGDQIIPRPESWRLGPPAVWAGRHDGTAPIDLEPLLARVRERGIGQPVDPVDPQSRASAVLVALVEGERGVTSERGADGDRGAEVLLTKRSWDMRTHRGEISFPGGRLDPGETPWGAALREAHEEIGLDPAAVEVVGELDHISTFVSKSFIVPVVARVHGRPRLTAATAEVQRILSVPLADLYRPDTYRQELWFRPPMDRPIHFFELDDETIWGATGRMLVQLLALAVGLDVAVSGL